MPKKSARRNRNMKNTRTSPFPTPTWVRAFTEITSRHDSERGVRRDLVL